MSASWLNTVPERQRNQVRRIAGIPVCT